MQLNHYNSKFKPQDFPVTLVTDNVSDAANIGSLFRAADAFGVAQLILCGDRIPLGKKMSRTARASEKSVPYQTAASALAVVKQLKANGAVILSLEITDTSLPIHSFKFLKGKPIVLVLGDENFGVSDAILKLSDALIHIDMFGVNSSMNVVQACTIALYEITKQLRVF